MHGAEFTMAGAITRYKHSAAYLWRATMRSQMPRGRYAVAFARPERKSCTGAALRHVIYTRQTLRDGVHRYQPRTWRGSATILIRDARRGKAIVETCCEA
jgi:hypothetical protein